MEFWESAFREKQEMWGSEPCDAALIALNLFREKKAKNILVPGFGYGRNAKTFVDNGFDVTGIEISETAIALAKKHYGDRLNVYHGSVTEMPFDRMMYDGIFCYALIHLLDSEERLKLIDDCYNQLNVGGTMVFVAISTDSPSFGKGVKIGENRFEANPGAKIYFYDTDAIKDEFGKYGFVSFEPVSESEKSKSSLKFWLIQCNK